MVDMKPCVALKISVVLFFAVNISAKLYVNKLPIISTNPDDIHFYLYNYRNNSLARDELIFNSQGKQIPLTFNSYLPTAFIVHGYTTDDLALQTNAIISAAHKFPIPENLIVVDWQRLSQPASYPNIKYFAGYPAATFINAPQVGKRLAELISMLISLHLATPEKVHVIGYSVGAHIAGYAGAMVQSVTGKKIGRITGLDPAGPLYQPPIQLPQLHMSNAQFVDIIHTNAGVLGTTEDEGHVNIYVNGGEEQWPVCVLSAPAAEPFCSSEYAITVYAYSVNAPVLGCRRLGVSESQVTTVEGLMELSKPPVIYPFLPGCADPLLIGPFTNWAARGLFDIKLNVAVTPLYVGPVPLNK